MNSTERDETILYLWQKLETMVYGTPRAKKSPDETYFVLKALVAFLYASKNIDGVNKDDKMARCGKAGGEILALLASINLEPFDKMSIDLRTAYDKLNNILSRYGMKFDED